MVEKVQDRADGGDLMRCKVGSVGLAFLAATSYSCALAGSLSRVVQPLEFKEAADRPAEIRLAGPSPSLPLGGAGVRLWLDVENPNPIGITLSTLQARLLLDNSPAAHGEFPLGLPLRAGEDSLVPLDLSISFAEIPGLANVIRRALQSGAAPYVLEGTFAIDAGPIGRATFGPMTLATGELHGVR
jgi:hypothetical protein